jgi:peptide/nickel transport system substrate-binding protein
MSDNNDQRTALRRRRYLTAVGAGLVGGVAGCSGDGGGDGNGNGGGGGDGDGDGGGDGGDGGGDGGDGGGDGGDGGSSATFVQNTEAQNISNLHVNMYSPTKTSGDLANLLFDPTAWYNRRSADFVSNIITDWDFGGDPYTVTVSEDYTWHNGEPVTAEDVAVGYKLDIGTQGPPADFIDGIDAVQVVDDTTVEMTPKKSVGANIAAYGLLPGDLNTPRTEYTQFVESFADASTEDEKKEARKSLINWKWNLDDAYGNGPFELTKVGDITYSMELFEDHPFADEFNFSNYEIEQANEEQAFQAAKAGKLDGIQAGMTKTMVNNLKEKGWTLKGQPWGFGFFLNVNYQKLPAFRDRRVRWAVNYAINKELATKDSIQYRPVKRPTGMIQTWNGNAWKILDVDPETFISYEQDQEKAANLLREAGLSKENGSWVTSDGKPLNLGKIPFISKYAPVVNMWRSVIAQLNEFGIKAEMGGTSPADWNQKLRAGNYTAANAAWGGFSLHPYYNFRWNIKGGTGGGYDVFHQSDFRKFGEEGEAAYEVEIPPIGEQDADPSETLNLLDALDTIFSTGDNQERIELYRKLAWWQNWDLGQIILEEFDGPNTFIAPDWELPPNEEAVWGYSGSIADFVARGNLNKK